MEGLMNEATREKVRAILEKISSKFASANDYRPVLNDEDDITVSMNLKGGKAVIENYQEKLMATLMFNQTSLNHTVSSLFEDYCRVFAVEADEKTKHAFFSGMLALKGQSELNRRRESSGDDDDDELSSDDFEELKDKDPKKLMAKLLNAVKSGRAELVGIEKKKKMEDEDDDGRQSYIG